MIDASPPEALLRLAVAALGGLAVGIEREWSAQLDKKNTRFGGVRTFLLLGLLGGMAPVLHDQRQWAGTAVLAAGAALVVVAYLATAWRGSIDATTEVAGLVVLTAGAMAGSGQLVIASAVFATAALVLVEKSRMHAAVERLRSAELGAAARFAVLALVVLPLLPAHLDSPLGELEPRRLWILVLLFCGLSFAGYVALRVAGPERGYGLAGLLGGIVSSTAVTLNFARESRKREELATALGYGVLAAAVVLPVRVLVLAGAIEIGVARALLPALLPVLGVATAIVVVGLRRRGDAKPDAKALLPDNPLRLMVALQMALLFTLVLWGLGWVRERFGSSGLLGGAVLLGLTDLDALTYSMARLAASGTPAETAARALVVGQLANTVFKAALAATLGAAPFRRVALVGFGALAAAYAAGLLFVGRI